VSDADLTQLATRQVRGRGRRLDRLQQAIADVPGASPLDTLGAVADALVPAVGIEVATIRLLDERGRLHLLAACGLSEGQLLRLALAPLDAAGLDAAPDRNPLARVGVPWFRAFWLEDGDERLGLVTVGSRSDRRPDRDDRILIERAVRELARNVRSVVRTERFLRSLSLELARRVELGRPGSTVGLLRPRERAVLALYADGLGTREIAELLVLSPHTIRTHVRNALKHLGVNTRREAAELVAGGEPPYL
jgi:DNA-binding CsgD family transcriptional regulator